MNISWLVQAGSPKRQRERHLARSGLPAIVSSVLTYRTTVASTGVAIRRCADSAAPVAARSLSDTGREPVVAKVTSTSSRAVPSGRNVASFRQLDQRTLASLKPLTIRIFTARPGDTQDSLAARMSGVDRPRELFRVLNHLSPGAPIAAGTKVKIVTDR